MKRTVSTLLWVLVAGGLLGGFVAAGRWSTTPLQWGDLGGWVDEVPPEEALIELVRWVGIALTGYVLLVATLVLLAEVAAAVRLAPLAGVLRSVGSLCAVPALRRPLVRASTATALTVSTLSMSGVGGAVAASAPVEQTVDAAVGAVALPEGLSPTAFAGFELPAAAPIVAEPSLEPGSAEVTVEAGDTLWDLAVGVYGRCDGAMIEGLAARNGLVDPSLIFPGQMLLFPADLAAPAAPVEVPPGAASWGVHRIVAGDTLWDVLESHYGWVDGDLVWTVAAANGIDDPSDIPIGTDVALPPVGGDGPAPLIASPAPEVGPPAAAEPAPAPVAAAPEAVQVVESAEWPPPATEAAAEPAPPTAAEPAPAPVAAAAPRTAEITVADDESGGVEGGDGSSVLLPLGTAGGAAVVAGAVGEWLRRRRRSPWPAVAPLRRAAVVAELEDLAVGLAEAEGLSPLEWAAAVLRRLLGDSVGLAPMSVEVDEATLSVLWVGSQPLAPRPWWADEQGAVWHVSRSCWLPPRADDPPPALSGLVTIGDRDGRRFLLNLQQAGAVSIDGQGTDALASSMVRDLIAEHPFPAAVVQWGTTPLAVEGLAVTILESDDPTAAELVAAAAGGSRQVVVVLGASDLPTAVDVRLDGEGVARLDPWQIHVRVPRHDPGELLADEAAGGPPADQVASFADPLEAQAVTLAVTPAAVAVLDDPAVERQPEEEPAAAPARERPRVLLRVFGDVRVEGAGVTQAVAVPFLVAAAGRPLGSTEISSLTGYAPKTLSSTYTSTHPVLARRDGALSLGDGVWTDHDWILECVARAATGLSDVDAADVGAEWLREALLGADEIDGAPYAHPPGNARPWAWVDEFPLDVSTRARAAQNLVEAVLLAVELWKVAGADGLHPSTALVATCCRLARLLPYAAVARSVRPTEWRSGAECLLAAAFEVASVSGQRPLIADVQAEARKLVADGVIEASDELANALAL